jgi:ornithine cyclodeaminase/alanine dehydrogenase-like protein (mu-crystallin family)
MLLSKHSELFSATASQESQENSMIQPILIRPDELRGIVSMKEAIDAVRLGFREWGGNPQINAPRRRIHIPTGVRVSVHQGGVPGAGATGMMTHCEWVKPLSDRQEYPRLNHPVIVLYDAAEGQLKAIIIGEITSSELPDNIAVTGLRTAATSALGTDLLARGDAEQVGLLGSGGQARNHLAALCAVRKVKQVKVFSPTEANRERFAETMGPRLKVDIVPVSTAAEARTSFSPRPIPAFRSSTETCSRRERTSQRSSEATWAWFRGDLPERNGARSTTRPCERAISSR